MFWNLLSASNSNSDGGATGCGSTESTIFLVIMIAIFVLFMVWNRRSQKKREEEINKTLDAIQPGNKVKTIGGICGIVVEVCPEDNTFILETGSETTGKSYVKFDKKAVYQTDATATKTEAPVEEAPVEEAPAQEEVFEEAVVETVEEAPAETTEE